MCIANLDIYEIDPEYVMRNDFDSFMEYLGNLLADVNPGGEKDMGMMPGMEELFSLLKIAEIYNSGEYERVIVDCAPTGETLSLLKYPERLSAMMQKVLPVKRAGVKTVGPVVEKVMNVPMPKDSVFEDIEYLMDKMQRLQALLSDKEVVSLRVVTTPEKIVISEAKRNFTCLYLYYYNVDAVIVNHIYPDRAMEGYFSKWIKLQEEGLNEIRESFGVVPCFYVELQTRELRELETLTEVGESIFGECDPNEVLFRQEIYTVDLENQWLKIYLPFAGKEELRLEQERDELIVAVRNESRRFPIPSEFEGEDIAGARFQDGYLYITFG